MIYAPATRQLCTIIHSSSSCSVCNFLHFSSKKQPKKEKKVWKFKVIPEFCSSSLLCGRWKCEDVCKFLAVLNESYLPSVLRNYSHSSTGDGMPKEKKFIHSTEERKVSQRQEIQTFPLIYNNSIFVTIMRHLQFLHSSLQSYSIFPDARLDFWLISWQRSGEGSEQKNRAALSWAWKRLPFFFHLFSLISCIVCRLAGERDCIQHSTDRDSFISRWNWIVFFIFLYCFVAFFLLLLQMIHAQVGWFLLRTWNKTFHLICLRYESFLSKDHYSLPG